MAILHSQPTREKCGTSTWTRPNFASAAEYIAHVHQALRTGRQPWEPMTRQELEAAVDAFPNQPYRWRPTPEALELIGLPETFSRPVEPFPEAWRERHIATLAVDQTYARAAAIVQAGGAA